MKKICIFFLAIILSFNFYGCNKPVKNVSNKPQTNGKTIFLTFDDGPSNNTYEILDILKAENIKATFFVVKREGFKSAYQRIVNEGHIIGGHTASHIYSEIYKSVDSYLDDLAELDSFVNKNCGIHFDIIRFPGGSNNTISTNYSDINIMDNIIKGTDSLGYVYYDWNVYAKENQSGEAIAEDIIKQCSNKINSIVLMHDAPNCKESVKALPIIIKELKKSGYRFDCINSNTPVIRFK